MSRNRYFRTLAVASDKRRNKPPPDRSLQHGKDLAPSSAFVALVVAILIVLGITMFATGCSQAQVNRDLEACSYTPPSHGR